MDFYLALFRLIMNTNIHFFVIDFDKSYNTLNSSDLCRKCELFRKIIFGNVISFLYLLPEM